MNSSQTLFNVRNMFQKELILVDVEAKDCYSLLKRMSDLAYEKGLVYETFKKAVIEREKSFPTGLETTGIRIAIPHTDATHVKHPKVIVAKLKKPVVFKAMGMEEKDIPVDVVFMLLINNDSHQVFLLQNMMNLCMNEEVSEELMKTDSAQKIYEIIEEYYLDHAEY